MPLGWFGGVRGRGRFLFCEKKIGVSGWRRKKKGLLSFPALFFLSLISWENKGRLMRNHVFCRVCNNGGYPRLFGAFGGLVLYRSRLSGFFLLFVSPLGMERRMAIGLVGVSTGFLNSFWAFGRKVVVAGWRILDG